MLHIHPKACPKKGHFHYDPARHRDGYKGGCLICQELYKFWLESERIDRMIEAYHARTHT